MALQPLLRFAPSPTGSLHLGGLRTALFNHLYAKKLGGKWILRVEDTDATRFVEGSVDDIRSSLEWAGLEYDYGPGKGGPHVPYFQSERRDLYLSYAQKLLDSGHAYRCFCTPDRLQKTREKLARTGTNSTYDKACLHLTVEEVARRIRAGEKSVIRLNDGQLPVRSTPPDLIFGSVRDAHASIATDPVLLKSDLFPTYHLAVVVDDHEMGITHVMRGEEWLPSLPLHLDLYACFGIAPPRFAHLPLLLNPDGSKMSKRKGDVRVADYVEKGWEPMGILSWLALTGRDTSHDHHHAHPPPPESQPKFDKDKGSKGSEPQEYELSSITDIVSLNDLVATFDLASYTNRRTVLDPARLAHLNRHHIFLKSRSSDGLEEFVRRAKVLVKKRYPDCDIESFDFNAIIRSLEDRVTKFDEIPKLVKFLFQNPDYTSTESLAMRKQLADDTYRIVLTESIKLLSSYYVSWDENSLRVALEDIRHQKSAMTVLRHALTAEKTGPSVVAILRLLGKEKAIRRLKDVLESEGKN